MAAHKKNRNRGRHIAHKRRLKARKDKFDGLAAFVYDIEPRSKKRASSRMGPL